MPDHCHAGQVALVRCARAAGPFDAFIRDERGAAAIEFVALSASALVLGIVVVSWLAPSVHARMSSLESLTRDLHSAPEAIADAFAGAQGAVGASSGNGEAAGTERVAGSPGAKAFRLVDRAGTCKERF